MHLEASLKNKTLYKLFLLLLKCIPMIIALCYILNTLAAIFCIDCFVLSHLAGISLFTWIFLYLSAIVFRFCNYHKMFLWYILLDDIVNIIDYYFYIPVSDFGIIALHLSLIGIFLFIILYLYVKHNKKTTA